MPAFFRRLVTPAARHIEREQLRLRLDDAVEIDVLRVRDPRARRLKLSVDERGARLTLPPGLTPATASVQAVAGQPLQAWWQTDISSRPWRRLLNEIQMVWHDHPVNQARQEQGQPTVNALWLYGGAQPWTPAPSTDSAWQDDSLLACAQQGDWHAWLAAVARLDRTMFAPLVDPQRRPTGPLTLTLLGERRVARLDLVARPTWLRWLPSSQIDWKHWWSLPA